MGRSVYIQHTPAACTRAKDKHSEIGTTSFWVFLNGRSQFPDFVKTSTGAHMGAAQ